MDKHYTTLSKSELAQRCNVSIGTVRHWCNVDFYAELAEMGYTKNQKVFTPKQAEFLRKNLLEYAE